MDIAYTFSTLSGFATQIFASGDKFLLFAALIAAFILFIYNKWRYDVVALVILLAVVVMGVIPLDHAFEGFIHPAVIIVTSMFVLGKALVASGVIEAIIRKLMGGFIARHPVLQLLILVTLVAVASAFVNNIGALAFMMPIAIRMARKSDVSPSMFLIPLAFGSHLGGFLTLIGSPRNVIVSTFRKQATGDPFRMFDFAYVGVGLAVIGILFLSFIAWRFLARRKDDGARENIFEVHNYMTEVKVPEDSPVVGKTITALRDSVDSVIDITALVRDGHRIDHPVHSTRLAPNDILLIQDDPTALTDLVEANNLMLVGNKAVERGVTNEDQTVDMEVIVRPDSLMFGRRWTDIPFSDRFGVNLLAVARDDAQLNDRLENITFESGDILLLRGRKESIASTIQRLGCLPLADRELAFGRNPRMWLTLLIVAATVGLASVNIVPIHLLFAVSALLVVLLNLVSLQDAYDSIQWPVVILLGAMITIGLALERTGGAQYIADLLMSLSDALGPTALLAGVLVITTLLSDFVNSNVSAVLMAPIGISLAASIGVSVDPFLMAVAVGSSVAFLTPYGHESNALVMRPGRYTVKDYLKTGLPLELLIIGSSIPLILHFWPL